MKDMTQRFPQGEREFENYTETLSNEFIEIVKKQQEAFKKMVKGELSLDEYKEIVNKRAEIEKTMYQ